MGLSVIGTFIPDLRAASGNPQVYPPQRGDMPCIEPMMFGAGNDSREVPIVRPKRFIQRVAEIGTGKSGASFDGKCVIAPVSEAHSLVQVQLLPLAQINLEDDAGNGRIWGGNQCRLARTVLTRLGEFELLPVRNARSQGPCRWAAVKQPSRQHVRAISEVEKRHRPSFL
jgi:hypothetical protein